MAIKDDKIKKDIVGKVLDAILASGKPFSEIPKKSIDSYLISIGVKGSLMEDIYNEVKKASTIYNAPKEYANIKSGGTYSNTAMAESDYTKKYISDVKTREPRKSVFSEITKLI